MSDRPSRYDHFADFYEGDEPPPWDSGIVPPEVRALVEGENPLTPGRALDIGCGTGVSSVYLAAHGWQVTGVDWVEAALTRARERAREAGLNDEQVRFLQASVESPGFLPDHPPVTLWLDVGCLHSLPPESRPIYARHAARLTAPGGMAVMYVWRRHQREDGEAGLDPDEVAAMLALAFTLEKMTLSREATDTSRPSAWYWLRRRPEASG